MADELYLNRCEGSKGETWWSSIADCTGCVGRGKS